MAKRALKLAKVEHVSARVEFEGSGNSNLSGLLALAPAACCSRSEQTNIAVSAHRSHRESAA
jgi:hypothetical protein